MNANRRSSATRGCGGRVVVCIAMVCVWMALFSQPAAAVTTYEYTGNHFTLFSCGGDSLCATTNPATSSYTTSDFVKATLTFAQPLPGNLHSQDVTGLPGFTLSMNDGHQTFTSTAVPQTTQTVLISTDFLGQIIAPWRVNGVTGSPPINSFIKTVNDVFGIEDEGQLSGPGYDPSMPWNNGSLLGALGGLPGTWVVGTTGGGGGGEPAPISLNGALADARTSAGDFNLPCSDGDNDVFCFKDSFVANVNSGSVFDATAYGRGAGGIATGRGKLTFGWTLPGGLQSTPGLDVGAYARASTQLSNSLSAAAHGVAFRTFHYTGTVPMTVMLKATLSGKFYITSPDFPVGDMGVFAEISVVKNAIFNSLLPSDPQLLENFFFGNPVAGVHAPGSLFNNRPAQKFASGKLAGDSVIFTQHGNYPISKSFSIPITLNPDQSFTVLFDIATLSSMGCQFSGSAQVCGAGTIDFFSSLSSAPHMFTDESGNPVTLIEAVGGALTIPGPLTFQARVTALKQLIASVPTSSLFAPNAKVAESQREALLHMLDNVYKLIGANDYKDAIGQLREILAKTDGILFPGDWIKPDDSYIVKKLLSDLIADMVLALPK